MSKLRTHYDNLQVARNANEAVIRAAYRALSQKYHPDKNLDDQSRAQARMKIINEAYAVLSNPERRAQHDAWIEQKENEFASEQRKKPEPRYYESNKGASPAESPPPSQRDIDEAKSRFQTPPKNAASSRDRQSSSTSGGNTSSKSQSSYSWNEFEELRFYHVLIACAAMAYFLTLRTSSIEGYGYENKSFLLLLLNPGFLGMALAPALMMCSFACGGWVVGQVVSSWKKNSAWIALAFSIIVGALIFLGQNSQIEQRANFSNASSKKVTSAPVEKRGNVAESTLSKALPSTVPTSHRASTQSMTYYNQVVAEIERKYPQLNPDSPAYREDIVQAVLARKTLYVNQGQPAHEAIRRAVFDVM